MLFLARKMGCFVAAAIVLLVSISVAVPTIAKTVYTVGDSSGWALGIDYSAWTSSKTFAVGDKLEFKYGKEHNVYEVSESDYNACKLDNAINKHKSGNTKITLKSEGMRYFVCGVPGHCSYGQKLAVTVGAGGATTTPSTSDSSVLATASDASSGTLAPFGAAFVIASALVYIIV